MAIQNPNVTGNGVQDAWAFDATVLINLNAEQLGAILVALQSLPDGSSVDDLRDALISALSTQ